MCSSYPERSPKLQLAAGQPSIGECWTPPKKGSPHPRAKEKPPKDSRKVKISFIIKTPYLPELIRELKQNLVCTRTQRPHRD